VTSIFFTEIDLNPSGPTVVNDQYAAFGVHFANHYLAEDYDFYPSDGRGLAASINFIGQITVDFTAPRTSAAADHTGALQLDLYLEGVLLGSSIRSGTSGSGFIGVLSDSPFDRMVIRNPSSSVPLLDNLHFGAPIPAPAGFAVLGLGLGALRRRRRPR